MLKYQIKLDDDNLRQNEIQWSEGYLEQDLSSFSCVVDPSYHVEKYSKIRVATYNSDDADGIVSADTVNVIRQGYIIVKDKVYAVASGSTKDYVSDETVDYHYIVINGKYYYSYSGGTTPFYLTNFLHVEDGNIVEGDVEINGATTKVKIDTIYWIEDGYVNIDGDDYYYDKYESLSDEEKTLLGYNGEGILKYTENGESLAASVITDCSSIEFYPYETKNYKEVSHVTLTHEKEMNVDIDNIGYCKYYYYVLYKNHYCNVEKKENGDYVCQIPKYVLSGSATEYADNDELETVEFPLLMLYVGETNIDNAVHLTEEFLKELNVYSINDLRNVDAFIWVDSAMFYVEYSIMNANSGIEALVHVSSEHSNLDIGSVITFKNTSDLPHASIVYNMADYGGDDEEFIVFNGNKINVTKNVCDKVIINGTEYDISYPSGKTVGVDCLVTIDDEDVPMKISGTTDGEYSGGTLARYGKVVTSASNEAVDVTYSVKPYDGVEINGYPYIVSGSVVDGEVIDKHAELGINNEYSFGVINKLGSSLLVCIPKMDANEYTKEFIEHYKETMCSLLVSSQNALAAYTRNGIFGTEEITEGLAFKSESEPTSSDSYYNLFSELVLYSNGGYIQIPLNLKMDVANNAIQDNIVEHDFFEAEKKKAINSIVDMEKDVYIPKYFEGVYMGAKTKFKPIEEIRVNLHFRTRSLDNWKVKDSNTNQTAAAKSDKLGSSDNWFITDYHPYRELLESEKGEDLMEVSDLVGLLNFTNDDIFYQKKKVSKSFLRFSIYDSTDPQTQSLMDTACVFLDEHALYKKFIDNSRKNVNDYGIVKDIELQSSNGIINSDLTDITSGSVATKISVLSEYMGEHKGNKHALYKGEIKSLTATINSLFKVSAMTEDTNRLSSRLTIKSKYETDTSSEGFYYYIFREYQEKLHPKPIYMKVEFNHAGIGKTIPFLIPMHWETADTSNSISATTVGKMVPSNALSLSKTDDLSEMTSGTPLSYVYAQSYIPLYAVYDYENKEYAYVFDRRYVDDPTSGILNLNLFEMKIKDESSDSTIPTKETAVINVNAWAENRQFNFNDFHVDDISDEEMGNKKDRAKLK